MGKQSAPAAPDYAAAATAQGTANLESSQYTAALNRPDQYDPNGSQTWALKPGADPKNPQAGDWVVSTKLNPTQQALKDQQDALSSQYGGLASGALKSIGDTMSSRFDTSGLPQASSLNTNGLGAYGAAPTAYQGQGVGGPAQHSEVTAQNGGQMSPNAASLQSAAGPSSYQNGLGAVDQQLSPNAPSSWQMAPGMASHEVAPGQAYHDSAPGVNQNRAQLGSDGLPGVGQVQASTEASRQRVTDALYQRSRAMLDPQSQQQSSDLTSRLAAQGITEGSEAYNRAVDNQARQQSDSYANARNDAILAGGAEDTRIGNQNLGVAQFQNSTRGQLYGERQAESTMANQNIDSLFNQGLASSQFNNASRDTNWNQALSAADFNNKSKDTNWQQALTSAGFNNDAQNNQFSQGLASAGFNNSALNNQWQQGMSTAGFNNDAAKTAWDQQMAGINLNNSNANTNFTQGQSAAGFNNGVANDSFARQLAAMQANNSSRDTQFTQGLASQQFNNDAAQQYFQNQMTGATFNNAQRAQQFGENQAMTSANNTLHTNSVQEALMQRELAMNEANALRTGNQVGGTNFQAYGGAGQVAAAPIYQSTSDGYNAALAGVNANNAGVAGMYSGLTGLGSAAITKYSDRRLKRNIVKVGQHKLGIGLYVYNYVWGQSDIGVMADEVLAVMPEAVTMAPSGFLQVNYSKLG